MASGGIDVADSCMRADVVSDDPFSVIEAPPPQFTSGEAKAVCRDSYGMAVDAEPLVSERDQNFRLTESSGRTRILKIANALEDPEVTDFQVCALQYIASQDQRQVAVPEIVPTLSGEAHVRLEKGGASHVARVVSWLPGEPLDEERLSAQLCRDLGRYLAHLDLALAEFTHAGADQALLWDMKRAPQLRRLLPHVADARTRALLGDTLDEFECYVMPEFDTLGWQVIHNDANPNNVLAAADGQSVAGIIDFGDMLRSPRVIELGVAAAYLRVLDGNPLLLITELLAGYHAVSQLTRAEVSVLHVLIKTRLATTVAILAWRESIRGEHDAYLQEVGAAEQTALAFLEHLAEIPLPNAQQTYSQVCASVGRHARA